MARPPKSGLEYFPLDVDMDSDEKIVYVISKHGFISFGLVVKLYMEIYRRGYFIVWDERQRYILAHQLGIDADFLESVVQACVGEGLFDGNLFSLYGVLTSHGVQSRYIQACGRRRTIRIEKGICLLHESELNGARVEFTSENVNNNGVNVNNNGVIAGKNTGFTTVNADKTTESPPVMGDNNAVNVSNNGVNVDNNAKPEKEAPKQEFYNNGVNVDNNPSFGQKSKNQDFPKTVNVSNNEVNVSNNGVNVDIAYTETPQSKVNNIDVVAADNNNIKKYNNSNNNISGGEFSEFAKCFSENVHSVSGEIEAEKLGELFDRYGYKWCMEAVKEAALSHGTTVRYIESILASWERNGFKAPRQNRGGVRRGGDGNDAETAKGDEYSDYREADRNQIHPWNL